MARLTILNDLFHNCALTAYVTVWQETGQFPPDEQATKRLAYRLYEQELKAKRNPCAPSPSA